MRVSRLLNIYRRGHESATSSFDEKKAKDFSIAIAETWKLAKYTNTPEILYKLQNDVYVSFSFFLSSIVYSIKGDKMRMKLLRYLKQKVPDLFFKNNLTQIITSMLYEYSPRLLINLHYYGRKIKQSFINMLNFN